MGARERILDAAYDLFSRCGVRAVGVDIMKGSSVAAAEGDREAAARAREVGALMLASRT